MFFALRKQGMNEQFEFLWEWEQSNDLQVENLDLEHWGGLMTNETLNLQNLKRSGKACVIFLKVTNEDYL